MEKESLFQIIFKIRTYFSSSILFAIFNVSFKSLGIFLYTHNIRRLEDSNITLHFILSRLLIRTYEPYSLFNSASYLFFGVLLLFLLFIIASFLSYRKIQINRKDNLIYKHDLLLKKEKSFYYKISIGFFSVFLILLSLFNQHIIELLFAAVSSLSGILNEKLFHQYENPTISSLIPQAVINIITILLISCCHLIFMFFSIQKSEIVGYGYKSHSSYTSYVFIFFSIFFQALYSVTSLLTKNHRDLAQLMMCIIIVAFILFDLFMNLKTFSIHCTFISKYIFAIKLDCLFSGIIELILYFSISSSSISQQISIFKLFIELLFVIAIFILTYHILESKQINVMSQNILLQTNSKLTVEHLVLYFNLIKAYFLFDSMQNFHKLFDVMHNHIIQCVKSSCPCHHLSTFDSKEAQMSTTSKLEKLVKEMILIGEQEINNLIYTYTQEKEQKKLKELCISHIDYIALIKHDFVYAFYLSHSYFFKSQVNKWGIISRYYLYEIRKTLLKHYIFKNQTIPNRRTTQKLNISSINTSQLFTDDFYFHKYLRAVDTFYKCVFYCCENLDSTISYLSYSNIKKKNSSSDLIIKLFNRNIDLNRTLYANFKHSFSKKKYKNMEVDYLLTNYLLLYYGEIPSEYQNSLHYCLQYSTIKKKNQLYNDYPQETNVLITSMENDDTFKIKYVSQSFCDSFNWNKENILFRDFNDLLPKNIGSYHNIYMKLFCLFENSIYTKESFLLDEVKLLHCISLSARKLLNMSDGINIIFGIKNKKTKSIQERNTHLLVDYSFKIMNMEHSFESQFYFSKQMLSQLKLNFIELFGINKHKLLSHFKKSLKAHPKPPPIDDIIKAITVQNTIPNDKMFNFRGFHNFQLLCHKSVALIQTITLKRQEYNHNVIDIFQMIHDYNLENNLLDKIMTYKHLLAKTISNRDDNEEFNLTFTLKNINSLFYYVILIKEPITLETNLNSIHFENELFENVSLFKTDDYCTPKISTVKEKPRRHTLRFQSSPFSRNKSRTSSLSIYEQVSIDKSINNTNLKLINQTLVQENYSNQRPSIIKRNKPIKKNVVFTKWFDNGFENRSLFIIVIVIEFLFIINAVFSYLSLIVSLNIFYINYFSFLLKDDVMFCSLFFIRKCLIKEGINQNEYSDLSSTFAIRNDLFLSNMKRALSSVNKLSSYENLNVVYQALYNTSSYKSLSDGWDIVTYNATLIEEMHKMYYFFFSIISADNFNACGVKAYSTSNFKDESRSPYLEEKILHYINSNLLKTITNRLNRFSNYSLLLFQIIHDRATEIFILIYLLALVFCFLLYVFMIVILIHNKLRIKYSLERIYIFENENKFKLQKNLELLKVVANEFTKLNSEKYEESLRDKTVTIRSEKKKGSIFNSSLIQTENFKTNNNSSDDIQLFRLSLENLKHFSNLTRISLVFQVSIVITFLFLLNFGLHIFNLITSKQKYNFLAIQNDIGANFIGKIPMYAQLLLYALTSIIQNNPYSIPYKFNISYPNIPNLYNVSVDVESESIYTVLNGSNYVFVLFKLSIIQRTIEKYLVDESRKDLFNESIYWNNLFNEKDYFPIATSVGFIQFFTKCSLIKDCFTLVNNYSIENVDVNNKLSLNGFDSLFNLMITELNSLFVDFTINFSKDYNNIALLSNNDLWMIIENTMRVISMASNVFNHVTGSDINNSYLKSQNQRMSFSIFLIFFSLISIYTIIMVMLAKLKKTMLIIEDVGKKITKLKQIHSIE